MLSICIPVYNNSILSLVDTLCKQCTDRNISFEIICIDDASGPLYKAENKKIVGFPNVTYSELQENVGRAVIRNLLAQKARFEYLLYIDCDVTIPHEKYISTYVTYIHKSVPVVVGGILYDKTFINKNTALHFKYGTCRESRLALERNKKPYSSFLTGNLLLQKKIVSEIQFLSSLKEYGHEDTLFCLELKKRKIPIVHIDNAVIHEGLETDEMFVTKQLMAVKNLSVLIQKGYDMREVSLYDAYLFLKKYRLLGIFTSCFGLVKNTVLKLLISGKSHWLALFDALRLWELSDDLKEGKNKRRKE